MAEAAEGSSAPAKPSGSATKILGFAFAGLNLAVVGGATFYIFTQTMGYEPPRMSEQEAVRELAEFHHRLEKEPAMYTMEPFTTNLDGVPRRLIKVKMSLEMLDQEGFEEVITLGAQSRDSIMKILNAKTYDEIQTVQGKLHLKNQIIAQLNEFMKRGVVRQVFFSEFVVQ